MYALLCRRLGIDEGRAEELARDVYDQFGHADRWRAYDDVAPCFERLRAAGVKTGVISNWDTRLSGLLEGLGLSPMLDTVVTSAEIGMHKPDPRVFEYACAQLGVRPEQAAHVGDHYYADYVGATAVGMRGVMIDRHGLDSAPLSAPLITTLDDLDEVLLR
jgi:putative hydrolase of the HAD superfamily